MDTSQIYAQNLQFGDVLINHPEVPLTDVRVDPKNNYEMPDVHVTFDDGSRSHYSRHDLVRIVW